MDKVKKGNFLDHLTKGLYDAVVQAQALAENQHIEGLSKYVNEDGTHSVHDIILLISIILGSIEVSDIVIWASDINEDGFTNVQDILPLVNLIFSLPF